MQQGMETAVKYTCCLLPHTLPPQVPMPRVTITTFPVEIKPPNFTLPSFHAKPFSLPANFSLPASLQALAKIANFTALDLDLPDLNFTLPSLPTLTADGSHPGLALLSSLPNMLKFDRPVTNMTLPDVLAQWLAATVSKATLPRIVVPAARVNALKALIPGFTAPSVVMPTTLSALLSKVRRLLLPSCLPQHASVPNQESQNLAVKHSMHINQAVGDPAANCQYLVAGICPSVSLDHR
jgi:hypothetical protein